MSEIRISYDVYVHHKRLDGRLDQRALLESFDSKERAMQCAKRQKPDTKWSVIKQTVEIIAESK